METVIAGHATSWHDGGAAIFVPPGRIFALASERVGDRFKHSWNSRLAYDYLQKRLPGVDFEESDDQFVDPVHGLEADGHHRYHAASTFFGSGFERAAVLIVDGQGPAGDHLSTTTIWQGDGSQLDLLDDINIGHEPFAQLSLGHFYTAVTALAGFDQLYSEGRAMALAAYGRPSDYLEFFRRFIHTTPDGRFDVDPLLTLSVLGHTLGPAYYGWPEPTGSQRAVWRELQELRQSPTDASWPTQDDMNIAYAGQAVLEKIMLGLAIRAKRLTGERKLCLAGGVGLNCVANGKIRDSGTFDDVYVVLAPADDGQAIGRLYTLLAIRGEPCPPLTTAYLGPVYSDSEIVSAIWSHEANLGVVKKLDSGELVQACAHLLAEGKVLGWFRGGSELGPRALGHRSILADPRRPEMRDHLNQIKGREWFRPVAPLTLEEAAPDLFETDRPSPFMNFAVRARRKAATLIPAAIHVDGTARLQTLRRDQDALTYELITAFSDLTGVPVVLNTSFNGPNEPIVETPADAIASFLRLKLDRLVLGQYLIERRELAKT